MRKSLKVFLILAIFFLSFGYIKALDERKIVTNIVATSNIDSVAKYGSTIEAPTFNITEGLEAEIQDGRWYHYESGKWMVRENNYQFNSGRWQYRTKVAITEENKELYVLSNQTKVNINEEDWTYSYSSSQGFANIYSKEYVFEPSSELNYFAHEKYRIYATYRDVAAYTISVADTVEGGVEPYVFEKVSGPNWLTVSEEGTVNGTPTVVGNNEDLVVRVTDANNDHKEITVPVEKTMLPPAEREVIMNVTATSNTDTIPVLGAEIKDPTFNIQNGKGEKFANYNNGWYKKRGDRWEIQEGNFTEGVWQYRTHVILEREPAETYRLSDDTVVMVDGEDWNAALSGVGDEFYDLAVNSKEYVLAGPINNIKLNGTIVAPKVGADITEPVIWIESINDDPELVNLDAEVEAYWQYKTGDGFFDWANATGKFELNKTYYKRMLITIKSEVYILANIATFPVTFEGYELTQFQLNNKTVGEFIEFSSLKVLVTPTVNIKNNGKSLSLTWESQDAATKYEIYRSTSKTSNFKKINETTEPEYEDKSLTYGTTYYYKVRACDSEKCTAYSNLVSGKIAPDKVEGLNALTIGTSQVKLGWTKFDDMTGYEIYRSTKINGRYTLVVRTKNVDNYNNIRLSANTTYYYKVRTFKLVGRTRVYGAYSDIITVRTAPVAPKVSAIVTDYNQITLTVNSVKGASRYEIYRSNAKNVEYTKIGELAVAGKYTDNELTSGQAYYYKVRACNDSCGNYSSIVGRIPVPKTPSISLSISENKRVKVTITEINGADGYEIIRSLYKTRRYALVGTTETLEFIDEVGLNRRYYYKVRAYKIVNGNKVYGGYSGYKYTKVGLATPTITVSKNAFEEAKITINEVAGAAGYEIYRSTNRYRGFKVVKDTTELENTDELHLNTTYYYKVRAYIVANGNKYYSRYTKVKSIRLTLVTPTFTTERSALNKVNINLAELENAEGYEIYRSLYKNKRFVLVSDIAGLTYEDTVNFNTTYYYKVRAYVVRDGKKYYSNYTALKVVKLGLGIPTYTLEGQPQQVEVKINEVLYAEGYEIYRATSKYGRYLKVAETIEGTYNNPGQANKTYYYKIRAYATINEKKVYSGYSTIKYAKALALPLP